MARALRPQQKARYSAAMRPLSVWALAGAALVATACGDDSPPTAGGTGTGTQGSGGPTPGTADETGSDTSDTEPPELDVHGVAGGCYSVRTADDLWLQAAGADAFEFSAGDADSAAKFFLQPSDLATYLLYDQDAAYLTADDGPLLRQTELESDVTTVDDTYISGAEWELSPSPVDPSYYQFQHRRSGETLGGSGLVADADQGVPFSLEVATGCVPYPELSLDATGEVQPSTWPDGSVYGIVDTHSHIMSNLAFGGGGIFHGAPFHRLGVEHALPSCEPSHGTNGRKDFFGYAFDNGDDGADIASVLPELLEGELSEDNHETAGYPDFTGWPNAPSSSTHQTQYYRWLERAHLGGLRLVVQHATTNAVICELIVGQGIQPARYSCDDMVAVDRIIEETRAMERYIDAQLGGPGMGWFRIVETPAEAREVIEAGNMAVILGIETSDLFSCLLVPRDEHPECDAAYVIEQLDKYYALGVRAMFPVHKYDNAFSAGDGDRDFIELGNFFHSGHFGNFTLDCPEDIPAVFDKGNVGFGGLNDPRDEYLAPPPNDFSNFPSAPVATVISHLGALSDPALEGDYCQNAGLTELGETLLLEMMARGIIIEVDHLPQRSYARAFEMLVENDYPAAATHGSTFDGLLYELGGVGKTGINRCRAAGRPGAMLDRLNDRLDLITANGAYPAEGFGFDLNGFAGAQGPRFGEGVCPDPQEDPVTYPFESYAGDITFTQPQVGDREIDYSTEGMVHIGLLPELLEDARNDAVSDDDLEPLFRSAEGYIRMWERAEARGAALAGR